MTSAAVVTLLLTAFSIGIGVGAMTCARLAHGGAGTRLLLPAALGMALFSVALWLLPSHPPAEAQAGFAEVLEWGETNRLLLPHPEDAERVQLTMRGRLLSNELFSRIV